MPTAPQLKRAAEEFTQAALIRITTLSRFFPPECNPDVLAQFLSKPSPP